MLALVKPCGEKDQVILEAKANIMSEGSQSKRPDLILPLVKR